MSRMDILTPAEISSINNSSVLVQKYGQAIDRESAYEILSRKVSETEKEAADEAARKEWENERRREEEKLPHTAIFWKKGKNSTGPDGKSPDQRHIYKRRLRDTEKGDEIK